MFKVVVITTEANICLNSPEQKHIHFLCEKRTLKKQVSKENFEIYLYYHIYLSKNYLSANVFFPLVMITAPVRQQQNIPRKFESPLSKLLNCTRFTEIYHRTYKQSHTPSHLAVCCVTIFRQVV